jgi:hypothetical protein
MWVSIINFAQSSLEEGEADIYVHSPSLQAAAPGNGSRTRSTNTSPSSFQFY